MFRPAALWTFGFLIAACAAANAPSPAPAPPAPAPPPTSSSSASAGAASLPQDAAVAQPTGIAQRAFYGAFLGAGDVGERFQSLVEPDAARGLAHRYRPGQKPPGLWWVADAKWSDPHSYEPLRSIEEVRWYFADEGTASRFVAARMTSLRDTQSEETEGPSFGNDCHVLRATVEGTIGTSTHYIYVFRVARLVAELQFDQGPRSRTALTEDLVVPLARRAAERAVAAQD
jgi:hypothetical protein